MIDISRWENAVISRIALAIQVIGEPHIKRIVHKNRPFHGFVLNEGNALRDYVFSDGRVMRTEAHTLFYLPKGSSYEAYPINSGDNTSCYAINFDSDVTDIPFAINFRNPEPLIKCFHNAIRAWQEQAPFYNIVIRKNIYSILLLMEQEQRRLYIPGTHEKLILPAMEKIRADFSKNEISVAELAKLCGISEAYFRRIFINKYGVSPKEYIIDLRINYAKQLLESGEVSVSQAATLCGYSEATHFSREFKRIVGISPNLYKKQII